MKYLFIITGCVEKNSSFVRLRQLGYYLSRLGINVYYLLDRTFHNEKLVELLDYAQVILINESHYNIKFRLDQIYARHKAIKIISPDVVHFLNPSPNNTAEDNGIDMYYQDTDSCHLKDADIPKLARAFQDEVS